jgi:SnoaL-like protein
VGQPDRDGSAVLSAKLIQEGEGALELLLSKDAIRDAILRVARGVDRCDLELIRSGYHGDAHEEHGWFSGNAWEFAEKLVEQKRAESEYLSHFISNILIELDGEAASAESYFLAVQRAIGADKPSVAGGRYLDRFERRQAEWLISRRLVIVDWTLPEADPTATRDSLFPRGRRDRTDPSYGEVGQR